MKKLKWEKFRLTESADLKERLLYFNVSHPVKNITVERAYGIDSFIYNPQTEEVSDEIYSILQAEAQIFTFLHYADEIKKQEPFLACQIYLNQARDGNNLSEFVLQALGEQAYLKFITTRVYQDAHKALLNLHDVIKTPSNIPDNFPQFLNESCFECLNLNAKILSLLVNRQDKYSKYKYKEWQLERDQIIHLKDILNLKYLEIKDPEQASKIKAEQAAADEANTFTGRMKNAFLTAWGSVSSYLNAPAYERLSTSDTPRVAQVAPQTFESNQDMVHEDPRESSRNKLKNE